MAQAETPTLTRSADPISARLAAVMARVPASIEALLADRAALAARIAEGRGEWQPLAQRLLEVEARLRAAGPGLDAVLAPAFGDDDPESVPWSCRSDSPHGPPAAGIGAEDWVARACADSVRSAVGPVTAEIIPVVDGTERPYVLMGDPRGNVIHVRADSPAMVWAHEFGHLVEESIPAVKKAAMALWMKTAGAGGHGGAGRAGMTRRVSQLSRAWRPEDMVRTGFADPYWGLIPTRGATEVVSGGMGAMLFSPGRFFVADPLHWAFIMAVLAGDYMQ